MPVSTKIVPTSHADIAICETGGKGLPIVFLHGNSSCKEVFRPQFASPMAEAHRLIGIDLPGHGASSDAGAPERSYTMPGYAECVVEVLSQLGVNRAAVVGWSLGGHIALEMMPRFEGMAGVMISSTPPVGRGMEAVMAGFQPIPQAGLAGKPDLTAEEAEMFLFAIYGGTADEAMRAAMKRTDGRARAVMFQGLMSGQTSDQKAIAENSKVPIAVVNGALDPIVNVAYVESLNYKTLWDHHCYLMRGAGHAPLWQVAENVNPVIARFGVEMEKRPAGQRVGRSRIAAA